MKLLRTPHFERNYAKASQQVQRAFDKQSLLLLRISTIRRSAPRNTTRAGGSGRRCVNKDWRFYFLIQNDGYLIVNIIPHPK